MKIVYFYKKDGVNIPIFHGSGNGYSFLVRQNKKMIERIQKDYPEAIDNLFALVEGTVFKIPYV